MIWDIIWSVVGDYLWDDEGYCTMKWRTILNILRKEQVQCWIIYMVIAINRYGQDAEARHWQVSKEAEEEVKCFEWWKDDDIQCSEEYGKHGTPIRNMLENRLGGTATQIYQRLLTLGNNVRYLSIWCKSRTSYKGCDWRKLNDRSSVADLSR